MSKDQRDDLRHPMQPIGLDKAGTPRFKQNKIVRYLQDASGVDLNALTVMVQEDMFSEEDYDQLMQLIGYSTGGYGELSSSSAATVAAADDIADALVKRKKQEE